ncbi:hypothetical protein BDQ17DRAFT_1376863 [Cyathus striatus]|nr:hypothetical protein BDQ17DRAFT_1376863 [Cyathus striatus]
MKYVNLKCNTKAFLLLFETTRCSAQVHIRSLSQGHANISNRSWSVQVITLVSSYWRSLAISFPLLWTKIIVDFPASLGSKSRVETIRYYIQRCLLSSNEAPLQIDTAS